MMIRTFTIFILLFNVALIGFSHAQPADLETLILQEKSHDRETFTQGLIVNNGELIETSGLYGKSYIVRYQAKDNRIINKRALPAAYFAEGITQVDDRLFVLTWREQQLFVLDAQTLETIKTLNYAGEGWGVTFDGQDLITSDGSSQLTYRNRDTFAPKRTITVTDGDKTWNQLNELEFAQGLIWANVWLSPIILAIHPETGKVVGKADLSKWVALNNHTPYSSVLNGIAYDKKCNAFWITGKLWPHRYLVRFKWPKDHSVPASLEAAPIKPSIPDMPQGKTPETRPNEASDKRQPAPALTP